jgi:branched-chain amino acid transport system permease protein
MDVLVYGLVNSAILALMAVGFTLVYGISRLANFAHGALYVLTGFVTWIFLHTLGLNYALAILIALFITALIGALVYHVFLVRVRSLEASEIIGSLWRAYAGGVLLVMALPFQNLSKGP